MEHQQDQYRAVIERSHNDAQMLSAGPRFFACALQSNVDLVMEWNAARFSQFLADKSFADGAPFQPEQTIFSVEALIQTFLYYMERGEGGGAAILSDDALQFLKQEFKAKNALGGTGAQSAAALGHFTYPVLVHLTDSSKDVQALLDHERIDTICHQQRVPVARAVDCEFNARHYIWQFDAGDTVSWATGSFTIPKSNRLILDDDTIHADPPINGDFFSYCEKEAEHILTYSISGLHLIVDETVLRKVASLLLEHFARLRQKNPDLPVYFELAHYASRDVMHLAVECLSPQIDILGINEDELSMFMGEPCHRAPDLPARLTWLRHKLKVPAICLHMRTFSALSGVDTNDPAYRDALIMGNTLAGAKAAYDRYATPEDCLNYADFPLSAEGVRQVEKMQDCEAEQYVAVPARDIGLPKATIGLGDCFAAGIQTGLWRQQHAIRRAEHACSY